MGSTFDNLLGKAKNVAGAATKMTGEVVELSKVKMQAFKINTNIQKTYEKLGSVVYDSMKFGVDSKELIDSCVAEIDALLIELDQVNTAADGNSSKGSAIRCLSCGCENAAGSFFCARCGAPVNLTEEPQYTAPTEVSEETPEKPAE